MRVGMDGSKTPAVTEAKKLRGAYLNNIAVAVAVGGIVLPFIAWQPTSIEDFVFPALWGPVISTLAALWGSWSLHRLAQLAVS